MFFFCSRLCSFRCDFPWFASMYSFSGQAWAEGKWGACNGPPRADCGQGTDCTYLHYPTWSYANND